MVRARDLRNAAELARPRDLGQELEGVDDVLLDLAPLVLGEAALVDGQDAGLLRREHRAPPAAVVLPRARGDLEQRAGEVLWLHRRLVDRHHDVEGLVELGDGGGEIGV